LKKINVKFGGNRDEYEILVGFDILEQIGSAIKRLDIGNSVFLITSPRIAKFHLKTLLRGLTKYKFENISVAHVPDGEKNKSFTSYKKLLTSLLEFDKNNNQRTFIVNLGGGVIGDLGGFVAATYKRGTAYVQVPTTLLGFVDCGIGGKVAVNFNGVKNIIGAFHQPKLVYADLSLLATLDKKEMISGMAEVIKYGVIRSPALFKIIEDNIDKIFSLDKNIIETIALESYSIKADIVSKDEFDSKGVRAVLNYGHTLGHAVESASSYAYKHGEAVSIGMACANDIAVKLGKLDNDTALRIERLLLKTGLPVKAKGLDPSAVMNYFQKDKKFIHGKNRLVLATAIGKTEIVEDIPAHIIKDVIHERLVNN
jgi:3-dehydroquinate synthase